MRLAGQVKMGYYPTPDRVVGLLSKLVLFPPYSKAGAFDPCCGEGRALKALCEGRNALTFGIELDGKRAEEAKGRLDRVIHAGYEQVEVPAESMGLLFLNPPYDNNEGERKELTLLRDNFGTLAREGILIYIIPAKRLSRDVASLLAANFSRIEVFRFPDPEYGDFKQIAVLGRKIDWPTDSPEGAKKLQESAAEENLKELPENSVPRFSIPSTPEAVLHKREISLEELSKLLVQSPLWGRLSTLVEAGEIGELASPPTPLHVGHLGLLLAAGRLNGIVGAGKDRHIVVGRPEKHIVESEETEEDAEGNEFTVKKRLETFRIAIKLLRPTGEIVKLV
jgi:hypothetical protein